jgi:hypothetical protein
MSKLHFLGIRFHVLVPKEEIGAPRLKNHTVSQFTSDSNSIYYFSKRPQQILISCVQSMNQKTAEKAIAPTIMVVSL